MGMVRGASHSLYFLGRIVRWHGRPNTRHNSHDMTRKIPDRLARGECVTDAVDDQIDRLHKELATRKGDNLAIFIRTPVGARDEVCLPVNSKCRPAFESSTIGDQDIPCV